MYQSCKRGCRKCFPNGCCGFCKPPPQVQKQINTVINLEKEVKQTIIPYGYIHFYPGVRSSENKYTCPMLSLHLYTHSQHKANLAQDNRTVVVQGTTDQVALQGPQSVKRQNKTTAEEEIIMIPVEDVVTIGSQLEMKKALQADVKSEDEPIYGFLDNRFDRCWDSTKKRCLDICGCCQQSNKVAPVVRNTVLIQDDPNRNAEIIQSEQHYEPKKETCTDHCRCWCCKKRVLKRLITRAHIKEETEAQRVITVTIEYSKYSNLDTPTHTRLLSEEQQRAYYKDKFNKDAVKKRFYLVNNTEFDPANFELKKAEAETLCRTVMQLKAMRDHYPSERELDDILNLAYKRTFGDLYTEPTLHIPIESLSSITTQNSRSTQPIAQAPQRPAIEQRSNSTTIQRTVTGINITEEISDEDDN